MDTLNTCKCLLIPFFRLRNRAKLTCAGGLKLRRIPHFAPSLICAGNCRAQICFVHLRTRPVENRIVGDGQCSGVAHVGVPAA